MPISETNTRRMSSTDMTEADLSSISTFVDTFFASALPDAGPLLRRSVAVSGTISLALAVVIRSFSNSFANRDCCTMPCRWWVIKLHEQFKPGNSSRSINATCNCGCSATLSACRLFVSFDACPLLESFTSHSYLAKQDKRTSQVLVHAYSKTTVLLIQPHGLASRNVLRRRLTRLPCDNYSPVYNDRSLPREPSRTSNFLGSITSDLVPSRSLLRSLVSTVYASVPTCDLCSA